MFLSIVPALFSTDNNILAFIIPFGLEALLMDCIIMHHIPQKETSSLKLAILVPNLFRR